MFASLLLLLLPLAMAQDAGILRLSTDNANCLDPTGCRLPELCRSLDVVLNPSHAERNGDLLDIKCNSDGDLDEDDPLVYINVRYKRKGFDENDITRNTYRFRFARDTMTARGLELVQLFNSVYFTDGAARSLVFNQRLGGCDAGRADFVLFGQSYCLMNTANDAQTDTCAAQITYDDTQCGCELCGHYSWTPDCSNIDPRLAADCEVRWPNFHHQLARYYTNDGKGPKHELFANKNGESKSAIGAVIVWILALALLAIAGRYAWKRWGGRKDDMNKDIGAARYTDETDTSAATPGIGGEVHLT